MTGVLLAAAAPALADGTVAYLDYGRLVHEAPQAKASHARLSSDSAAGIAKIREERKEVQRLQSKWQSLGPGTNQIERSEVFEDLRKAQDRLRKDRHSYNLGQSLRQRQLMENFRGLVRKEVADYAKTHGIALVIMSGTVYSGASVDITSAILKRLKADYAEAQQSSKQGS